MTLKVNLTVVKQNFFRIIVLLAAAFTLSSCRVDEKESVLILTFEHLSSQENLCNREKGNLRHSGFLELCSESIRFTHAYASSTLTVPNLSTLMTGLYPYQHQVRHNGPPGLNAEFVTLPEIAVQNNFRTALFSGGPPVFRKSGLNQGFELFDEKIKLTPRTFHSPFSDLISSFQEWITNEVRHQPFLATFYVPDLLFKDSVKTDFTEARGPGFENQLDEIDEALFQLISAMKKNQIWNKTTVIVLGLNGRPNPERGGVPLPLNLHSENIQVSLLIKPSFDSQSTHSYRTFDAPVSIADVSRTVFELLGQGLRKKNATEGYFPVLSLKKNLESTSAPWPGQRAIPIESGWLQGHGLGETRGGAIINHELLFFDEIPKLYNTLTDRLESRPLIFRSFNQKPIEGIIQHLKEVGYKPWSWPSSLSRDIFQIPSELWSNSALESKLLERIDQLTSASTPKSPLDAWAALFSLQRRQNKRLIKFLKRLNYPQWSSEVNPCYQLVGKKDLAFNDRKSCHSKLFLSWLDWNRSETKKTETELMKTALFKALAQQEIKRRIQKLNWSLQLIWNDYDLSVPEINELDWVISKPEFSKDRLLFSKALETVEKQVYQESEFISY